LSRYHIIVCKQRRLVLLTTFSSTAKRSLQPHNDKLLIGGQQFLIIVHVFCSCFFLTPILTSIFVLQFLVTCTIIYFFIRVGTFPFIVVPLVATTTCYVAHDRLPYGYVFNDLVIIPVSKSHSMTLVLLSDHKRILLNDSHFAFILIHTIIRRLLIRAFVPHHSFILIHAPFHHFTTASLIDIYFIQSQFRFKCYVPYVISLFSFTHFFHSPNVLQGSPRFNYRCYVPFLCIISYFVHSIFFLLRAARQSAFLF